MCVAGLYFVFLLLEDVIISYYSTDAVSQDQNKNIKAAYEVFRKDGLAKPLGRNISKQSNNVQIFRLGTNITATPRHLLKKRQVERVTGKPYEIINVLWRKTKTFVDDYNIYTTTPTRRVNTTKVLMKRHKEGIPNIFSALTTASLTTTPSKIEFYYLDDDRASKISDQNCKNNSTNTIHSKHVKRKSNKSPSFLVFHLRAPYIKEPVYNPVNMSGMRLNRPEKFTRHSAKNDQNSFIKEDTKLNKIRVKTFDLIPRKTLMHNKTTMINTIKLNMLNGLNDRTSFKTVSNAESKTVSDRIKFFEMYDKYTPIPYVVKANTPERNWYDENEIHRNRKVLLDNIDEKNTHTHVQAKHAKKHVTEHFQTFDKPCCEKANKEDASAKHQIINATLIGQANETVIDMKKNLTNTMHSPYKSFISNLNITASWSEYPFAAVYIYEPMQVHCDAAGINAHWLVASGSCLSRVRKKFDGEGRSAFVAYCGELWWQPERVAYVKYSVVHPWYHPRDRTRKHLYNIGVIQVVNSMLTCTGWAPVSLMSHQFAVEPGGSWAYAVGWGLDRFDTRYGATNLPRTPLMIYKSLVYFDSCPGNIGYSKAKRLDEGGGVNNVHCLSLPPYSGEEDDPVHGGLLLVNGKLIALYLQEERRPWGEQSAQYTGIWRLIPWLTEVAKEPDEIDSLIFEI